MQTRNYREAEILVQKLSSDMGIHRNPRKGTLYAPEKILEGFSFSREVLIEEVFPDEFDLEETQKRIEDNTKDLAKYGKPIISIGGDHSVSFPVIKALKQRFPDMQLVWVDSHLDMKEKVNGHVSHDVVVRELLENGFSEKELWIVGTTRMDEDEEEFLEDFDLRIYRYDELEKFIREFNSGEQPIYLSVDIDVMKEELAPGTGYPDGELVFDQVERIIDTAEPDFGDIVEVAPPFDKENKTVEAARKIMRKLETSL